MYPYSFKGLHILFCLLRSYIFSYITVLLCYFAVIIFHQPTMDGNCISDKLQRIKHHPTFFLQFVKQISLLVYPS